MESTSRTAVLKSYTGEFFACIKELIDSIKELNSDIEELNNDTEGSTAYIKELMSYSAEFYS
jgi:hypothetical protein